MLHLPGPKASGYAAVSDDAGDCSSRVFTESVYKGRKKNNKENRLNYGRTQIHKQGEEMGPIKRDPPAQIPGLSHVTNIPLWEAIAPNTDIVIN